MEGNVDSPPRYQPKHVHMPEVSDSESDYEQKLLAEARANKAQMQSYNQVPEDKSESSEELDIGAPQQQDVRRIDTEMDESESKISDHEYQNQHHSRPTMGVKQPAFSNPMMQHGNFGQYPFQS